MKPILIGALAAVAVGLAAVFPFVLVLGIMVAPLLLIVAVSGWGATRRSSRKPRPDRAESGHRHVITPDAR